MRWRTFFARFRQEPPLDRTMHIAADRALAELDDSGYVRTFVDRSDPDRFVTIFVAVGGREYLDERVWPTVRTWVDDRAADEAREARRAAREARRDETLGRHPVIDE